MNKTYQPFIIAKSDEIFEILKGEIEKSDFMANRLCNKLTQKFINGELNADDPVNTIFKDEEELFSFVSEAVLYEDLKHLMELGLIGFLDEEDEDGQIFFMTEKGKKYAENMVLNK